MLIPLRYRLLNPPPRVVGRDVELEWAASALNRAPVTWIWGVAGIGKSTLAAAALGPVERAVKLRVQVEPGGDSDPARLVLRALIAPEPLGDLGPSEEAWDASVIDRAERDEALVLLEDAHHLPEDRLSRFVTRLADYGRRSRWVITSRAASNVGALRTQERELGALDEEALGRLAEAWGCAPEERARAVDEAHGSPWRLSWAVSGHGSVGDALSGLDGDARELLVLAAITHEPLPLELFDADVAALLRRSALALGEAGDRLQLHDVVAQRVIEELEPEELREGRLKAARALAAVDDPALRLSAIRLVLDAGARGEAGEMVTAHAEELLHHGYAPWLWNALRDELPPKLRMRIAIEVGPEALRSLSEPVDADQEVQLRWAQVLFARGRHGDAMAAASAAREAASDPVIRAEATLWMCSAFSVRGELQDALDMLTALEVDESVEGMTAIHDRQMAGICFVAHKLGESERARSLAPTLDARFAASSERAKYSIAHSLCVFYRDSGELGRAVDVIDRLSQGAGMRLHTSVGRSFDVMRIWMLVDVGKLELAAAQTQPIRPLLEPKGGAGSLLAYVDARRLHALGEWPELVDRLTRIGSPDALPAVARGRWVALKAEASWQLGGVVPPPAALSPSGDVLGEAIAASARAELAARLGEAPTPLIESELPEAEIGRARVDAIRSMHDRDRALNDATRAADVAERTSFRRLEIEARLLLCDLALAVDAPGRWRHELEALRGRLDGVDGERYLDELALHDWLRNEEGVAELVLLRDRVRSPVTVRRARALTGEDVPLDKVDAAVVAAVRRASSWAPAQTVEGDAGERWWIDAIHHTVVASDGEAVKLGAHTISWRLLESLVEHGGSATKEELTWSVWGDKPYHPLRHDNRLKLAARNARRAMPPSLRNAIRATDDGYSLIGIVSLHRRVT